MKYAPGSHTPSSQLHYIDNPLPSFGEQIPSGPPFTHNYPSSAAWPFILPQRVHVTTIASLLKADKYWSVSLEMTVGEPADDAILNEESDQIQMPDMN